MEQGQSPVIPKKPEIMELSFPEALKAVIKGRRITRLEWKDSKVYLHLGRGFLLINKKGEDHVLTVSGGDLLGTDWIILPELN